MKSVLLALALLVTMAQERSVPEGWKCDNRAKTPADHACACHRTCAWDPETKTVVEKEDVACKVYCTRSACLCLSECDSH